MVSSSCPLKGLGCRLAADGSQCGSSEHEFETRKSQCTEFASRCLPARLDPDECHSIMLQRVVPAVGYPMAVTRFTPNQCQQLNSAINRVLLPKMKINRHMPLAVIYSPLRLGGLNWPSFQVKQDCDSILTLIKHLRHDEIMANDIKVALSAWQLASGLCTPFLETVTPTLPYLGDGWLPHMRNRLAAMEGTIWIEDQWCPQLQRSGDQAIMSAFMSIPGITKSILQSANYVRLYLRVITLSDLTNIQGTHIPSAHLNGEWRCSSNLHWPDIPKPPRKLFALFRSLLCKATAQRTRSLHMTTPLYLDKALGGWVSAQRHVKHTMYRTLSQLFQHNDSGDYTVYTQETSQRFVYTTTSQILPSTAHPTTATVENEYAYTHHPYIRIPTPSTDSHHRQEWSFTSTDTRHAGSDGSVDAISGERASAYCVHTGSTTVTGAVKFPTSEFSTSFRSELE